MIDDRDVGSRLEKIYICHIVEKQPMIDREWAEAFAREWVDAWNAHDLERILSHYTDDFEMASPLIVERMGVASGRLKGKEAFAATGVRGWLGHQTSGSSSCK